MHPLIEERSRELPVKRLCHLSGIPRASYYRATSHEEAVAPHPDEALVREIVSICEDMPSYGTPRVTAELRRRGHKVNRKRV
jgi:hypothetical protein